MDTYIDYLNRYNYNNNNNTNINKISFLQLNNLIRQLWEEHITWTRLAIISVANSLPDASLVSDRLLRNATDFGNLFSYFYGPQVGQEFAALIHNHLSIAADLVVAVKRHDNTAASEIEKKWYKNADDIANFLSRINPNWNKDEIQKMMYEHLDLTKHEAVAILTNRYSDGIRLFDDIEKQALRMADIYTYGLARQFPNQVVNY